MNRAIGLFVALGLLIGHFYCSPAFAAEGYATYFTRASCLKEQPQYGAVMASGVPLDDESLICALPSHPTGKEYIVYNARDSRQYAVVKHMDYGPGKGPRKRGVVIDLSKRAFLQVCGDLKQGKCQVNYMEII